MSIRLNKALRELNIGLQTAVEFLEKKSELGEVKSEPSFKLSDAQYQALVEAFKQDAEVRNQAEKIFQKKPKEKKRAKETKEAKEERVAETASSQQRYKPLGKIDLSVFDKKSAAKNTVAHEAQKVSEPQEEPAKKAAAVSPEPEKEKVEKPAEEPKVETTVAQESKENVRKTEPKTEKPTVNTTSEDRKTKAEEGVEPRQSVNPQEGDAPQESGEPQNGGDEIFQTKSELRLQNAPKVNVLGKIDLSAINQSTRPRRRKARKNVAGNGRKNEAADVKNGYASTKKGLTSMQPLSKSAAMEAVTSREMLTEETLTRKTGRTKGVTRNRWR